MEAELNAKEELLQRYLPVYHHRIVKAAAYMGQLADAKARLLRLQLKKSNAA